MRVFLLASAIFTWSVSAHAETKAIINGTFHTVTESGVLTNATVLIEDDMIVAVGNDVDVPDDATVIDAGGRPVTPGLINVFSKIGLLEVGQVNAADD